MSSQKNSLVGLHNQKTKKVLKILKVSIKDGLRSIKVFPSDQPSFSIKIDATTTLL